MNDSDDFDALLDELDQRREPDVAELVSRFRRQQQHQNKTEQRQQARKARQEQKRKQEEAEAQLRSKRKLKPCMLVLDRKDVDWLRGMRRMVPYPIWRKELSRLLAAPESLVIMSHAEAMRQTARYLGAEGAAKGAKKGGETRMSALTPEERTALARKAA